MGSKTFPAFYEDGRELLNSSSSALLEGCTTSKNGLPPGGRWTFLWAKRKTLLQIAVETGFHSAVELIMKPTQHPKTQLWF
jgi:hypothetical protein